MVHDTRDSACTVSHSLFGSPPVKELSYPAEPACRCTCNGGMRIEALVEKPHGSKYPNLQVNFLC